MRAPTSVCGRSARSRIRRRLRQQYQVDVEPAKLPPIASACRKSPRPSAGATSMLGRRRLRTTATSSSSAVSGSSRAWRTLRTWSSARRATRSSSRPWRRSQSARSSDAALDSGGREALAVGHALRRESAARDRTGKREIADRARLARHAFRRPCRVPVRSTRSMTAR